MIILRCIPGHHWVCLSYGAGILPGHHWIYRGLIRRDTFTVFGRGIVFSRMPLRRGAA